MRYTASLLLFAAMLTGFCCQQATTPADNGKTIISGMIYQRDGATPASGVVITIHPADMLFFPQETGLAKTTAIIDTILTRENGMFRVGTSLSPGAYIVEAKKANDIALVDTIEITAQSQTITTPQATLKPSGVVKGTVVLPENGGYREVFVLVYGIDRFTRVQEDGSFHLYNLGEGTYSLRIVSLLEHYGVFDATGIRVASADTTNLGTIVLPFNGIPVPQNVAAVYDTLAMRVTLRWNRCAATDINGYVIYRKISDSNLVFTKITPQPVRDTFMTDSTVEQPFRYEYRVAAMKMNNEEGTKSGCITVTAASYFTVDTVFDMYRCEPSPWGSFAISGDGDYYFSGAGCILAYDRDMHFKRRFGERHLSNVYTQGTIDVDNDGRVYVLCVIPDSVAVLPGTTILKTSHNVIYIFDASGVVIDSIGDTTSQFSLFDEKDGLVYIAYSDTVAIYTGNGTRHRAWNSGRTYALAKGGDDRIYCLSYTDTYEMLVFDTIGTILSRFIYPHIFAMDKLHYDAVRERLYILSGYCDITKPTDRTIALRVLDKSNTVVATFAKRLLNVSSDLYLSVGLSDNGEVAMMYHCIGGGVYTTVFYHDLTRLNPLNW